MDVLKDDNDLMSRLGESKLGQSKHSNCALTIEAYIDSGGKSRRVLILVLWMEVVRLNSRYSPCQVGS
jgi:hypothetical protein